MSFYSQNIPDPFSRSNLSEVADFSSIAQPPSKQKLDSKERIIHQIYSTHAEQIGLIRDQIMEIAITYLEIDREDLIETRYLVQNAIASYFSTAAHFFEHGLRFQIQENVGLSIAFEKSADAHELVLKLDEKVMHKESSLAFILTEESHGIVFQTKTFTIKKLELNRLCDCSLT